MPRSIAALDELASRLSPLGWMSDLWVAGSLATGDYVPGVSDLDLVAVAEGEVSDQRQAVLAMLHRDLDAGLAAGLDLGCVYVDGARLLLAEARHPTWTHRRLVQRTLSGVARAELVRHGHALLGREPSGVLPSMSDDAVREAARAEASGCWAWAAPGPAWLIDQVRDRRRGQSVTSPRIRTALIAWRDARRTVRLVRASATRRPAGH